MTNHAARLNSLIAPLRATMVDFDESTVRRALTALFSPDARVRLFHPIGETSGAALCDRAYAPLFEAMPDLERRDLIIVAGDDEAHEHWVGCRPFL